MIDFTSFKNNGEKLIALFLSLSPPLEQQEIVATLGLSRRHCYEHLRRLKDAGIIEALQERRATLFRYANGTKTVLAVQLLFVCICIDIWQNTYRVHKSPVARLRNLCKIG
jgi:DNA-binding transcriptional ArsR family regulator